VRELRNIIERAILLRQGRDIHPSALLRTSGESVRPSQSQQDPAPIMTLKQMEADHIRRALDRMDGNHTHTAKALGISRSTLMRKIQTLQINRS
jgi:transcriptional regulator with PAS, ATPase and Fis domain